MIALFEIHQLIVEFDLVAQIIARVIRRIVRAEIIKVRTSEMIDVILVKEWDFLEISIVVLYTNPHKWCKNPSNQRVFEKDE